jgi:hypothetical protein
MRTALGRCHCGINKITICFIKKNSYKIRKSINTNDSSRMGISCVRHGPILKKTKRTRVDGWKMEHGKDCQIVE